MTVEFVTPPGRIVWGNPARSQTKKDQKTKQPIIKDGKPVEQWVFGVAFTKAEFEQQVMPHLQQEVASLFPNGVPAKFSWKFKDGDGVDGQGKPYNTREGYAGHYILTVSTEVFAPPIYKNENGKYRQIEAHEIKTGDYIVVKLNVKANAPADASHTPGIYVNPQGIELIGYGQEIITSGINPDEAFGGKTYTLPPGASATPLAPVGGVVAPNMGNVPAAPVANLSPAAASSVPVNAFAGLTTIQPPANAAPMPPPAHDFVANAGMPAATPVGVVAQPLAAPAPIPQPYAVPQDQPTKQGMPIPPVMAGIPAGR